MSDLEISNFFLYKNKKTIINLSSAVFHRMLMDKCCDVYICRRSHYTMIQTQVPISTTTMRQTSISFILRLMSHVTSGNTNQVSPAHNMVNQGEQLHLDRYNRTWINTRECQFMFSDLNLNIIMLNDETFSNFCPKN